MSQPADADTATAAPSSWWAIRLVAGRELSIRLRSRAFNVMTVIMVVIIVGGVIAIKLFDTYGSGSTRIGVMAADAAQLEQISELGSTLGQQFQTVVVDDEDAGVRRVRDDDLAALLAITPDGNLAVTVSEGMSPVLQGAVTLLAQSMVLEQQIWSLGGDPATIAGAIAAASPEVTTLSPPRDYDVAALILGSVAGILIFITLQIGGQYVALGVVEEKSSRVVELLLSTIRPWELMAGKVAGIGLLGLIQMLLYGGLGIGLAVGLGVLELSVTAAASTIVWLVVWYLIGFVMYAFAFAGAAALVSRQEDAGGVMMPILAFVIGAYIVGITVLPSNPSSGFVEVLSLLPPFAPILMPMRLAMGGVPVWETVLSLVLALALIPALAALAGRIYRGAVIHLGARVSLRKALSS